MLHDKILEALPRWLRPVELESPGDRQAAISEAASTLAGSVVGRPTLDLVLLACGQEQQTAYAALSEAVREKDPTFGAAATDLETHLVAGVAVAAMLGSAKTSTLAAHAVLSGEWMGLEPAIADLPSLAVRALEERSEALRARVPVPGSGGVEKAFADVEAYSDDNVAIYSQDARAIAGGAKKGAASLSKAIQQLADAVTVRLDAADEELDVLWWAFSGFSDRAQSKWEIFAGDDGAGFVLGVEFAQLLRFAAELPSTNALVSRLLQAKADREVTIADAVESASPRLSDLELPEGHQLLPLLSSVSEHRALNGAAAWRESVSRWAIDTGAARTASQTAHQAIREVLLTRGL